MRKMAIIGLSLLFLVSLSSPVYAPDIDLTEFDDRLGDALGIGAFAGGIVATFIILFIALGCLGAVMKRRPSDAMVLFFGFVVLTLGIACGWWPIWSIVFLILLVSLMFGTKIIKGVK